MTSTRKTKPSPGEALAEMTPIIRGLLAESTDNEDRPFQTVILKSLTHAEAVRFADTPAGAAAGYPEPLIKGPNPPLYFQPLIADAAQYGEHLPKEFVAYKDKHHAKPQIVCVKGAGILYVERQYNDSMLPLKNKVALVTGSAGAIGYGVCRGLLESGAFLAASDLAGERLNELTAELNALAPGRIIGVPIDVTDKSSIAAGIRTVAGAFGGIDIVVINAGIAMAAHLRDIDTDEFRLLEKVNVEGTLFTLQAVADHMILQNTGGDIVLMSSKNVPSPGAGFGGYSATKAAAHQLGRLASIELAPHDIRVNMVAPDAVFSEGKFKSGLWEKVGPGRMQARGLDQAGLQDYYKNRNLLKARVTGKHVANAVLFFVTRQTPTTGATIPVDGGLPDATPR
ncbi:MAG: SDR family NAD(P)-dependent oxidoreductase [Phycisphaerae bacterium]|nr:SDR family NAD(P)-dependent oxidoreductase [Phycisphaerae bacterium]